LVSRCGQVVKQGSRSVGEVMRATVVTFPPTLRTKYCRWSASELLGDSCFALGIANVRFLPIRNVFPAADHSAIVSVKKENIVASPVRFVNQGNTVHARAMNWIWIS